MVAQSPQICVAPLSSPYSLLPRAHTYALVVALLLPLPRGWLFRAALAAFTTRTAVTAIDAAVLLHAVSSNNVAAEAVPLDALVALDVLGLAVVVACWLLLASRSAAGSAARPLIRAWAAVVTTGSVLAFVTVARLGRLATGGRLAVIDGTVARCGHGIPMDSVELFGSAEAISVLGSVGSNVAWLERRVGIPPLVLSALALLAIILPKSASLGARRDDTEENSAEIRKERAGPWSQLEPARVAAGVALMISLPGTAIFIAVSSEQYLHSMVNLPSAETSSSVGQWGVWAATGVVVAATLVNAVKDSAGLEGTSAAIVSHLPGPEQDEAIKF